MERAVNQKILLSLLSTQTKSANQAAESATFRGYNTTYTVDNEHFNTGRYILVDSNNYLAYKMQK